ncbi:cobalt ECF transporter T component CbiQ [Desulfitobacterium metallireducens]|uniref:Cobalt ABC transporter permease n=1 Tax=Desulfitobacterium metallireducens DSM 15288 TaxID=871968 RepID=W0EBS1_9FIRM|nr:cobalt ECF transporter T component CbiQ [Desulfitobacterium metallireducens]AHF06521.1 cobalt ABC transporter permease [Desulfitobacterium metallireducens DSM 15288]
MELPSWLSEMSPAVQLDVGGGRRKRNFIEKTLKDIVSFLSDAFFSEKIALRKGFLQGLDPRVKVLSLIFLLVAVNLCSNLGLLWIFYFILLAIAVLSKLPFRLMLSRVWLVIPLFTGIMVFPSLFNWVRPGDPLWVIGNFGHPLRFGPLVFPATLAVSKQGVAGGILLISRVGISVSLAMVLTLSTRWMDILRALRSFFIPRIFISTTEMTYRYIFVLIKAMEEIFIARKARDAGQSSVKEQRSFIATTMGGLFGKSLQMSEEVYSAMVARGYTGEMRMIHQKSMVWQDIFILMVALLAGLIMIATNKVLGG